MHDFGEDGHGGGCLRSPSGEAQKNDGTHAWFAGLIGPEGQAPTHSFVSVVEYGGSGGRTAGPLATAFLRELARRGAFGGPTS